MTEEDHHELCRTLLSSEQARSEHWFKERDKYYRQSNAAFALYEQLRHNLCRKCKNGSTPIWDITTIERATAERWMSLERHEAALKEAKLRGRQQQKREDVETLKKWRNDYCAPESHEFLTATHAIEMLGYALIDANKEE